MANSAFNQTFVSLPLSIINGGSGGTTAAEARTNLGLASGGAGDIWVELAGDTMTGILNMGTNRITNVTDPSASQDAATKNYVDSNIQTTGFELTFAFMGS